LAQNLFCNWQLFKSPVGFAMTNSPIESYNNTIKESFTKRIKHHMKTAVEVFQDVICYESNHAKDFKTEIRVRKYMRVQAKSIVHNKQLIATNLDYEFLYKHFNPKMGFARINLSSKTCTCHTYLDKGVCKHLIAACLMTPTLFKVIRKRKNRQYIDDSRVYEEIVQELEVEPIVVPVAEPIAEQITENSVPKKRGRKPKNVTANPVTVGPGRPTLARNALVDDMVQPVLRRSERSKKN
jgi:hypothetical protein